MWTKFDIKVAFSSNFIEGFKEAAERFQEESGLVPPIDLNSMDNRIQIREAIQNGRIQEATLLVNQLHPELLDNDRYLYFHLQVKEQFCVFLCFLEIKAILFLRSGVPPLLCLLFVLFLFCSNFI